MDDAIRSQHLAEKAQIGKNILIGELALIGTATGVAEFGPAIAGTAVKAWPYVTGAAVGTYRFGERMYYRGLDFYMSHSTPINRAYDYISGLLTPPYLPPATRGGAAAALTTKLIEERRKK